MALAACGGGNSSSGNASSGSSSTNSNTNVGSGNFNTSNNPSAANIDKLRRATITSSNIKELALLVAHGTKAPMYFIERGPFGVVARIRQNNLQGSSFNYEGGCGTSGNIKVSFKNFYNGNATSNSNIEITANKCIDDMSQKIDGYAKVSYVNAENVNVTLRNFSSDFKKYYTGGTSEYNDVRDGYLHSQFYENGTTDGKIVGSGTMHKYYDKTTRKPVKITMEANNIIGTQELGKVSYKTTTPVTFDQISQSYKGGELTIEAANGTIVFSVLHNTAKIRATYNGSTKETIQIPDLKAFLGE